MVEQANTDVTVIGGGPAGSVAALLLARAGHRVRLIEQHRFPRGKMCGECLGSLGIDVLKRAGLGRGLSNLDPQQLNEVVLYARDGSSATINLSRPRWGLTRHAMDAALLQAAVTAGAVLVQPARCEAVEAGDWPAVRVRHLEGNTVASWRSRFVLVADGKGTLLPGRAKATGEFGLKAHFRGVNGPRDAIEMFGVNGHYGGIAAVEGERWNVAFSVPGRRIAESRGDLDGMFSAITGESRMLSTRMSRAVRCGDWITSPLPRFGVVSQWPLNVIPLGNAAAALEPIGGEGMGLALRSAEMAADAVDRALRGGAFDADALRRTFGRLWRVRRVACRAVGLGMSWPPFADAAVPTAAACESLAAMAIRYMAGGFGLDSDLSRVPRRAGD